MRTSLVVAGGLALVSVLAAPASSQCVSLGTPGQNGCGLDPTSVPSISCAGSPNVGNAAFQVVGGTPCVFAGSILLVGLCASPPVPVTGPFGTNAFCNPGPAGCTAYVDLNVVAVLLGIPTPAGVAFPLPVPNDPSILGAKVCAQEVITCALFVGVCIAVTNGISITIEP